MVSTIFFLIINVSVIFIKILTIKFNFLKAFYHTYMTYLSIFIIYFDAWVVSQILKYFGLGIVGLLATRICSPCSIGAQKNLGAAGDGHRTLSDVYPPLWVGVYLGDVEYPHWLTPSNHFQSGL
jgi:hypothetical protein